MSLESFKHRKETARSSLFRTRCNSKKAKRSETVTIRIGLFRYEPDRNVLKPQYGKNLNLTAEKSSTYAEILEQALTKRRAHDRHFCAEAQDNKYQLLYPDGSQAIFLPVKPGKFFSLQEYKDYMGSPFSAIKLFLCSVNDVNSFENGESSATHPPTSPSEDEDVVEDAENIVYCHPSFEENFHEDFLSNPPRLSSSQLSTEQSTPSNKEQTPSTSSKDLPSCSVPSTPSEYKCYLHVIDDDFYYNQEDFSMTLDDEADLDAAIAASLSDQGAHNSTGGALSVHDVIERFIVDNMKTDSDPACNIIRRKGIIQTTMKAIDRKKFSFFKPLVVTFSREEGVYSGGPKREYLRLLMKEIKNL